MNAQSQRLFTLLAYLFIFQNFSAGQTPCIASDEPPGCFLNSSVYTGITDNFTTSPVLSNITGFNCNSITNDAWMQFIPICSEVEIRFNAVNCRPRIGPQGVGVAVMDEFYQVKNLCYIFPTIGFRPKKLILDDLIPGKSYHLMLYNSLQGLNCNFHMTVEGIMTYGLDNSDMYGEFQIGENSVVKYYVENPGPSSVFNWTVDNGINIISGQDSYGAIVETPNSGSYQICCEITRVDDSVEKICKTILVDSNAPIIKYETAEFCPRSCYDFGNECRSASGIYQYQTTDGQGRTTNHVLELCENLDPRAKIFGSGYVYINGCVTDVTIRGGVERSAGSVSYHWVKRGEGKIPNSESEEFVTSEAGTYGFVVEDDATGCTDTAFVQVWVNENCNTDLCICDSNLEMPDTICDLVPGSTVIASRIECESHLSTSDPKSYLPNNTDCSTFVIDTGQIFEIIADSSIMELSLIPWGCDGLLPGGLRVVVIGRLASTGSYGLIECTFVNNCEHLTIRSENFIKGEFYFIQIEGVIGDKCDYAIIRGFQIPFYPPELDRDSIIKPGTREPCINNRVFYEAPLSDRIISYEWKIIGGNGAILSGANTNKIGVEWLEAGIGKISMIVTNNCTNQDTFYIEVPIKDLTVINNLPPMEVCPREFPIAPDDYCNSPYCPGFIVEPGTFCVNIPIPGNYCDSIVCYTFIKTTEKLTVIDTSFCVGQCLDWNGQQICSPGTFRFTNSSTDRCEEILELRVREINPEAKINPPGIYNCLTGEQVILSAANPTTISGAQYKWTSLDAGIIENIIDSRTIAVRGVGRYVLEIDFGGCSATDTVLVSGNLTTPQISCTARADSVFFSWDIIPGAVDYNVSIGGASPVTIAENFISVGNLSLLQNVEIEVSANGTFGCFGAFTKENCAAVGCPGLDIQIEQVPSVCFSQNNLQPIQLNYQISGGNSNATLIWSGQNISSSGIFDPNGLSPGDYPITLNYTEGLCNSTFNSVLTINPAPATFDTISTCAGTQVSIFGNQTDVAGNYSETFNSVFACDSTHAITLISKDTFNSFSQIYICQNQQAFIFGKLTDTPGLYHQNLQSAGGCDSNFTVELIIRDTVKTSEPASVCDNDSISIFGNFENIPGIYSQTFTGNDGCDSLHSIQLTENPTFAFFDTLQICFGDTIDFFGTPVFEQGDFSHIEQTRLGCDSIFNLKIVPARDTAFSTRNEFLCLGDTIIIFGNEVFDDGIFTDIEDDGFCVSKNEVVVTITDTPETFDTIFTCKGVPANIFSIETDVPNTYFETFASARLCDSIHAVTLEVGDTFSFFQPIVICSNEEIDIFGNITNAPGIYTQKLQTSEGCDSNFVIELIVLDTVETLESISICENDSVSIFGSFENERGIYSQAFSGINGCDSLHSIELKLNPVFAFSDTLQICSGDTINFFGTPIFEQGDFSHFEQTEQGCDSVFNLRIIPARDTAFNFQYENICPGDTILVFGNEVYEEGIFTDIEDDGFCVSKNEIEVNVDEISRTFDTISTCLGNPISVYGIQTDIPGTYTETYNRLTKCDSIHSTTLMTRDTFYDFKTRQICSGETIDIFGNLISVPGVYKMEFTARNGCDSLSVVELSVADTLRTEETLMVCQNDSIIIFGNFESAPGQYSETNPSIAGCDSVHVISLKNFPDFQYTASAEKACFGDNSGSATIQSSADGFYNYLWENGKQDSVNSNLKPGIYRFTITDENGCPKSDSVLIENDFFQIVSDELPPICFGEHNGSIEILSDEPNLELSLNNAPFSNQTIFENLPGGIYSIVIRNSNNCILKTEIRLPDPKELTVNLPNDTLLFWGESLEISPGLTGTPNNFKWYPPNALDCPDCPTTIARPHQSTIYFLEVKDMNNCFAIDSIQIKVQNDKNYFIPSGFSPNGDGNNDFFTVFGNRNLKLIKEMTIFDRWGELIWKGENLNPNQENIGWNGKFKGKEMNTGVFVFYAILEFSDGTEILEKGDITLNR